MAPAICCALFGKNIRPGPVASSRRFTIAKSGMRAGSKRPTRTRRSNGCWDGRSVSQLPRDFPDFLPPANGASLMLRIAIIGCGKIADAHLEQIQHIPGCRVDAACDREPLMARQLCDRFQIPHAFSDVARLLEVVRPDVVHITTPPQSHYSLARECLQAGANVYVEKPFTLNTRDAEQLIALANSLKLKLTVGHDLQFTQVARRLRQLVGEGYLGGEALHMESYYCYDLSDPVYARALLGDKHHWVRRLPGKLLQNIISHGIARVAECFTSECPDVLAHGRVSPALQKLGETDIVDELRVILSEPERTAYFTF